MSSLSFEAARAALREHFGHAAFRPMQGRVVASVLARRDTLAILPTGGGKSICFQVPALVQPHLTLVISPLIALMQDQVAALERHRVPAALLNSHLDRADQEVVVARARAGQLKLLYLSPERAPRAIQELGPVPISLLAIDEAHCVSEWGHDFRPAYRGLGALRQKLGPLPVVALTGSATPTVERDLVASLELRRPVIHRASFDRPNLRFEVEPVRLPASRFGRVIALARSRPGLMIVYLPTRNLTDAVARALRLAGLRAEPYHAALTRERRTGTLQRFVGGALDVVAATSAFGMGIDAPMVRLVVHWGIPPTPEAYYQEAGRAGRDGEPSRCLLLHHREDGMLHRRQLENTFPPARLLTRIWAGKVDRARIPRDVLESADRLARELEPSRRRVRWAGVRRRRRLALQRIRAMEVYASGRSCRRARLLDYFGERATRCEACDRCAPGWRG